MSSLKTRTVTVDGEELVVSEATFSMGNEKDYALSEIHKAFLGLEHDAALVLSVRYAKLAACTFGGVPSFNEFAELRDIEVNEWELAAIELNPHWFGLPPLEDKKKQAES